MQTNPNLPPVFDAVLSSITGAQETIQRCMVYHPVVGRRRTFHTLGDVCAYEAGFINFDRSKNDPRPGTSFALGWSDAAEAAKAGAQ